ncbi:MAG TPA: DUF1549 domain-containing protein [Blastocatellia bacterium]|nr:DUF1549 domain-containing protein [Blastocatellia bacterium]
MPSARKSNACARPLTKWMKLCVITGGAALLFIGMSERMGVLLKSKAQERTLRNEQTPNTKRKPPLPTTETEPLPSESMDDCSFLMNPTKFRDALAQHRAEVVRDLEQVNLIAELNPDVKLTNPNDIPRKNFIDNILFAKMAKDSVMSAPLCTDEEFLRRAYLDLTGRIPAPDAVTNFVKDTSPNKRDAVVDSLIGTPEYVDKWTMFLGDLYKNTANSPNVTRYVEGREAFYNFIKDALTTNKNYAQMVQEMIAASGDTFVNGQGNWIVGGIVTGGPAQDTMDGQAAQAAAMFLGLSSVDCLMCHSGRGHLDEINLWGKDRSRAEAWGMSAFFARTQRQRVDAQTPAAGRYFKYMINELTTGEYNLNTTSGNRQARQPINGVSTVQPRFIFGGGGVNTGENRRQALARLLTAEKQFARATVNYIWEKLMVEGLVSPSNSFDPARVEPNAVLPAGWSLQPANAELLEALTQDFIQSNYNLRTLIGRIAKSSAYQLSSQYPGTWSLAMVPYYARKYVRRLDAEELHDAIITATGIGVSYQMRDSLGNNTYVVNWAMQLRDTTGGTNDLLNSFLRGDRDAIDRSQDATLLQSLNLMNHSFVMGRVHQSNANSTVSKLLANTALTSQDIINQLYLTTLSRTPTTTEMNTLLSSFTTLTRREATESLQWVLLNKVDFIYNY